MNYQITPITTGYKPSLDDERFLITLHTEGSSLKTKFEVQTWDYATLYQYPGLYEQLLVNHLRSTTHIQSTEQFFNVRHSLKDTLPLRVLDYAAGVGLVGEQLKNSNQCETIIGMDLCESAKTHGIQSRRYVYDDYVIGDMAKTNTEQWHYLKQQNFNCIFCLSAVGMGHAGTDVFARFLELLPIDGWLVLTVRKDVLEDQQIILDQLAEKTVCHLNRVMFHRNLIDGNPFYCRTVIVRKKN